MQIASARAVSPSPSSASARSNSNTCPSSGVGAGTCVARSKDLIHWEKYAKNPIVRDNASSSILVATPEGDRLYAMHPKVRVYVHPKAKATDKR